VSVCKRCKYDLSILKYCAASFLVVLVKSVKDVRDSNLELVNAMQER